MREMKDSGVEWIGEIPVNWNLQKVKYLVKLINDKSESNDNYVGLENVESWTGNFLDSHNEAFEAEGQSISIKKGDLLFGKLRPYLAKAAIVNENGASSTEFLVLRCEHIVNKFLWRIMLSSKFIDEVNMSTYGAKMPRTSWAFIGNMYVSLPDIAEQKKITRFLDEKCTKIDDIVKKQQVIVEKLKEYKSSIINESVTKGLNRNVRLMKGGHRWIEDIPEHWEMVYAKKIFSQRRDRAYDTDEQLTSSQKYGIISQKTFMELEGRQVMQVLKGEEILKHVEKGDFVISMRSFQGGLEYSKVTGKISSAYVMLIPNPEFVYDNYYKWLFKSKKYISALQGTSNLIRDGQALRFSNFIQVYLPNPSIAEQKNIADYLDKKCPKIDDAISKRISLVNKLIEYKKSLIYEVVTGKREL